jgi:low affinity Fe/Cu permease
MPKSNSNASWFVSIQKAFSKMAGWSAEAMGSASAFVLATLACIVWAVSGPFFRYSDTWQLVINTATTVLTFLAVFLIQHSQNKEGKALQLKLDELIRSNESARNRLIDLEHCTEEELQELQEEFKKRRAGLSSRSNVAQAAEELSAQCGSDVAEAATHHELARREHGEDNEDDGDRQPEITRKAS